MLIGMTKDEERDLEELIGEEEFFDELEESMKVASQNMVQWHNRVLGYRQMREEVYRLIGRRNLLEYYRTADGSVGYRVRGRKEDIGFGHVGGD